MTWEPETGMDAVQEHLPGEFMSRLVENVLLDRNHIQPLTGFHAKVQTIGFPPNSDLEKNSRMVIA